jgi:hypothetical protein
MMQLTNDFDADYELYVYDGDDEKDMKVVLKQQMSSSSSWLKYIFYLFFSK